ncbi:MAG TPA: DUF6428 family protein [Bacteroidia bacterium]|nr:DUF6428 family protein [Bacteroidia bacterium]
MKLSEVKKVLGSAEMLNFELPDGTMVPEHFHVTEIGVISRDFIDCGGTVRKEKVANFQLWNASDVDHRLKPQKLMNIIALSEKVLGLGDLEVEVEYQSDTIGRYGLEFNGRNFLLTSKQTNCLASDKCGIPSEKTKLSLSSLQKSDAACCTPGSGCCN